MSEPLPDFDLEQPKTVDQAVAAAKADPDCRFLAGGTDLIVNMRRGLAEPTTLVDLTGVSELRRVAQDTEGLHIGAAATLHDVGEKEVVHRSYRAVAQACHGIAGPGHRTAATVGGNLCLDTRCLYYNQSHWWRKANNFCLKYKGDICHVAPAGKRCRAPFCGDLAPALMVHHAEVELAGPDGRRRIALGDLYQEDGADHLRLAPHEFVVAVHVPPVDPTSVRSGYVKVRLRGAIDFPLAGAAIACTRQDDGTVSFDVALTGTNSRPFLLEGVMPIAPGQDFEGALDELQKLVQKQVSPQRTTTTAAHYRRLAVSALTKRLAGELAAKLASM